MSTTALSPKQSVSFRWDAGLVNRLKTVAKEQNRSLSNFTETLLSRILNETEDVPNEITKSAFSEAKKHRTNLALGEKDDDNYVDLSSIESMTKSILK